MAMLPYVKRRQGEFPEVGGIRDDSLIAAEEKLKKTIIEQTQAILPELFSHVTEDNAPRALRLIEQTCELQRELLTRLSLSGEGAKPWKGGKWHPGSFDSGEADMETYGAAALDQLVSTIGQAAGPSDENRIKDLVTSIANATEVKDEELVKQLKVRLDKLMNPPKPSVLLSGPGQPGVLAGSGLQEATFVVDSPEAFLND